MTVELSFEDHVAILKLGSADEKAVVLNEERINSLDKAISEIDKKNNLRGAVFTGPSAISFCAGADVGAIKSITELNLAAKLATRGQAVLDRISQLKVTTVAAIGGACVGGGCELALACNYRIAIANEETKIGLPEVKLGILPGFGGSMRLPRLIGLPAALDIILQGKVISADKAKKIGLVDILIQSKADSYLELIKLAKSIVKGEVKVVRKSTSIQDKLLTFTPIGRSIVKKQALKKLLKETKGKYPAPLAALDVCIGALGLSKQQALALEIKEVSKLIISSQSKALVHLFLLTEKAKKLGRSASKEMQSIMVGILGGGVMGAGIAASLLEKGYAVVLCDIVEESRNKALQHIKSYIGSRRYLSDSQREHILSRLIVSAELKDFTNCGLVIEAIVEKLEVKQSVFKKLSEIVSSTAILASNTSSLSIDLIAEAATNPERVVGMHFFNPAEKMPLVEIVRGAKTSNATIVKTAAVTSKLGKFPVIVENVPGFLVNRVLAPYMAEASQLLSEGYSIEDIDSAAMDFGMPMGPIRLLDEVGLDVAAKVQSEMLNAYGARMSAPRYLEILIKAGRLGKKNGTGFYMYQDKDSTVDPSVYQLLNLVQDRKKSDSVYIAERLLLPLVNEAILCLDDSVAGLPGEDAAGQIDLATVMGTGFAPFEGGAINYAERIGAKALSGKLKALSKISITRFNAADGLQRRAEQHKSFYQAI